MSIKKIAELAGTSPATVFPNPYGVLQKNCIIFPTQLLRNSEKEALPVPLLFQ